MNIRGIYKTSLVNFPGRICTVLFTGGCNLRCRFCHNPELVQNSSNLEIYSVEYILDFLEKRKSKVNAVTISGGEPTIDSGIESFLKKLKDLDLIIKLDTNGLNPTVIERLVSNKLIDYAAVDVKTSPEKYELLTGIKVNFEHIINTISIVQECPLGMEIRTTCIPEFTELSDFEKIGAILGRVQKYYIQQFVTSNKLIDLNMTNTKPFSAAKLHELKVCIESFADLCEIRGL